MKKRRMQFDFTEDAYRRLEKLTKVSGASSKAELVRRALAMYDRAAQCMKEGGKLVIVTSDGEQKELLFVEGW